MNSSKKILSFLLMTIAIMVFGCSTDTAIDVRLNSNVMPDNGGTVTPTSGTFKQGSRVEITAVPAEGFSFVRWEGDVIGEENPKTIYLYGNQYLIAVFRADTFASGDGSIENPYQVSTFEDLLAIAEEHNLDKHFIQVNDIDASPSEGMGGMGSMGGFPGIGSREAPFTGTYDGNGYQISNLHLKYRDELLGLFRYIKDAEIKNVTIGKVDYGEAEKKMLDFSNLTEQATTDLISLEVDSDNFSVGGALVAYNDSGLISNCHTIRGIGSRFNYLGGLVGYNSGEIIHSSADNNVGGMGYLGGLVAINSGTIRNSYAKGYVGGMGHAGGLVGYNYGGDIIDSYSEVNSGAYVGGGLVAINNGLIQGSAALGDKVDSSFGPGGGLVAINYGEIKDSYSLADIRRHDQIAGTGGLVGENRGGTITHSFATGNVTAYDEVDTEQGGFAGVNSGNISLSYWNSETSGFEKGVGDGDSAGATGLTTLQMTGPAARDHMPDFDWSTVWITTTGYPMLQWQMED